jgi:hypothetical protein
MALRLMSACSLSIDIDFKEMLKKLFDLIISNPESEVDEDGKGKRPVTRMLSKVVELTATNYQPVTSDIRRRNQESGYLGELVEDEGQTR